MKEPRKKVEGLFKREEKREKDSRGVFLECFCPILIGEIRIPWLKALKSTRYSTFLPM